MNTRKHIKICFFGIYNPSYARNWVIINGLRKNGIEVLECREKPKRSSIFKLIWKYLRLKKDFDLMIVGFPGQEMMFLAKILTRKPIIFDAFTSHYGGYILDRKKWTENSFKASYFRFLDRWSCKLADIVLLDTNAHINFFVNEFGLDPKKFRRVFVSTDTDLFFPSPKPKESNSGKFMIHFHGSFVPLQGVSTILKAAKLIESENVSFNIIGKGQTYNECKQLAESLKLKNINFIDPVPYQKLKDYIINSDICLGIFGNTLKADIVIPNKIYEAIACRKAVISSDSEAIKELFTDNKNIILVKKHDPKDLAEKILMLKNNSDLTLKISENAYDLFYKECSPDKISENLKSIINEL